MGKDVTEYKGIKYSLQPHGLKSRLLLTLSFFVVAFGGALLAVSPANAAETTSPAPTTSAPPTTTLPASTPTSTVAAVVTTPAPVIVTVTVIKTVVVTKTVTKTVPVTVTETEIVERHPDQPEVLAANSEPQPTPTPPTVEPREVASGRSMAVWGGSLLIVSGVGGLIIAGLSSRARRRKYQGGHVADDQETQEFEVSDYHPSAGTGVSPELRATVVLPASNERSSED